MSSIESTRDALIDRCYDLYRDEYLRVFPSGGDEHDHADAIHAGVSAVVIEVLAPDLTGRELYTLVFEHSPRFWDRLNAPATAAWERAAKQLRYVSPTKETA